MKTKYLYLLWFAALLPVMILRDYTPNNELRYLSIIDEALRNGSFFTFTLDGEIYADKPPLSFWLMMAGKTVLGGHRMWFLSLLSFIPALVMLMIMEKWTKKENPSPDALLMLMTGGFFLALTITIRMDMLMVMFITLSLHTFFKMYRGEGKKRDAYLFPLYVFLALFSKGPVGILLPLLSTLIFLLCRGKIRTWNRYWGWKSWLILLAGCGIWFTGVYLEAGDAYLNNLLVRQTVGRGIDAFHHKSPFYYYAVAIWYSLAPWMLLSVGLIIAGAVRKKIQTETEKFFLTVILTTFVMLSLISSKLAVYMLPAIPFFIYLSALLLCKFNEKNAWLLLSVAVPALVFAAALPAVFFMDSYIAVPAVYAAAAVASLGGLTALYLLFRRKALRRAIRTMVFSLLLTIFIAGWAMPQLNPYMGWNELCGEAARIRAEKGASGYSVYAIPRAGSMDVFLKEKVAAASKEDILNGALSGRLLLLPQKAADRIQPALSGKEQYKTGAYLIVVF
jgi:4-amino-4-deoxy-L-arabinose transferase-like glycosyltransferase